MKSLWRVLLALLCSLAPAIARNYTVDWSVGALSAINNTLVVCLGDTVELEWSTAGNTSHLVYQQAAIGGCDPSVGSPKVIAEFVNVGNDIVLEIKKLSSSLLGRAISFEDGNTYNFTSYSDGSPGSSVVTQITSSSPRDQCLAGYQLSIVVKANSSGASPTPSIPSPLPTGTPPTPSTAHTTSTPPVTTPTSSPPTMPTISIVVGGVSGSPRCQCCVCAVLLLALLSSCVLSRLQ